MNLGVVVDIKPNFIQDLLADWRVRYKTNLFSFTEIRLPFSQGRVNRWRLKRSLRDFLSSSNDLIFFEWAGPLLVAASHLPMKTPTVVRLHSYEIFEFAPLINWRSVDKVVLVSEAMRRRFSTQYPEHAGKTEVIYNAASLSKFTPGPRSFGNNIGMLCKLLPIKRIYEMILAISELRRRGYCFRLRLGGPPGEGSTNLRYLASMKSAVEKLNLTDQVFFDGPVDDPENWLRNIDIFVSNSFWEGHQTALVEAMATGCYCLCHFWDGSEEVLPQEYLYATDSDLLDKLIAYAKMSDSEKRVHHGRIRGIAERQFDLQVGSARFSELFTKMLR